MKTKIVAAALILAALVAVVSVLWIDPSDSSRTPPKPKPSRPPEELRASGVSTDDEAPSRRPATGLPSSVTTSPRATTTAQSRPARLAKAIAVLDKLFGPQPEDLTDAAAEELMAGRLAAKREVIDQVAALGPGGARLVADFYRQNTVLRDRLLLLEGLGRLQDPEAVSVLTALFAEQGGLDEREKIVRALARRQEGAATDTLSSVVADRPEGGLQFAAVQGLSGRAAALPGLSALIQNGADRTARLEAIRSVGLIGDEAAKAALVGFAQDAVMPLSVRQMAVHELRRSFGAAALDGLQVLQNDPNESVHASAAKALAMIHVNRGALMKSRISQKKGPGSD